MDDNLTKSIQVTKIGLNRFIKTEDTNLDKQGRGCASERIWDTDKYDENTRYRIFKILIIKNPKLNL